MKWIINWFKWLLGYTLSTKEWADLVANRNRLYRAYCRGVITEKELVKLYRNPNSVY